MIGSRQRPDREISEHRLGGTGAFRSWRATYDLREIQGIITNGVEDQVLKFVDDVQEVLAECRHIEPGCGSEFKLMVRGGAVFMELYVRRTQPLRVMDRVKG